MKRFLIATAALVALAIGGCGGGGGGTGGGSATLIGRVLNVETGGAPSPVSSIQGTSGSPSTSSAVEDGSFALTPVNNGTTQVKVIPNHTPDAWPVFTYTFAAASGNTSIGDLWIGPEKVTVHGRALSAATNLPISGATVTFGGQTGTTNASGVFDLAGVAYSSTTQAAFWGIVGSVRKSPDFFKIDFTASPAVANAGVVDVGDILLTPSNDPNPPSTTPYNITGRVLPIGGSSGCIVTLKQGATAVRVFNVGSSGIYRFWIAPGTYDVTFQKGAQTAPTQPVTFTQPNQTVTVPDVTLN